MILLQNEQGKLSILDVSLFFLLIILAAIPWSNELFYPFFNYDLFTYLLKICCIFRLGFNEDYFISLFDYLFTIYWLLNLEILAMW